MRFSEWSDVTPIAVSSFEPEHPICRIDYPEQYEAALGYMFAAIEAGELSERALSLVARVIELNPAHYTAWYYRRRCLRALGKSKLVAELNYIEEVAQINPKNYQIWYHRRAVAEEIGNSSQELRFIDRILCNDSKNYHAWAHRQWVLAEGPKEAPHEGLDRGAKAIEIARSEMKATAEFISSDMRNNSAWNHRWFTLRRLFPSCGKDEQLHLIREEADFALGYIERAPHNESAWNYLRGLFFSRGNWTTFPLSDVPNVKVCCQKMWKGDAINCPFLVQFLADMKEREGDFQSALELLMHLRDIDEIRLKYWERRIKRNTLKLAAADHQEN